MKTPGLDYSIAFPAVEAPRYSESPHKVISR